jgi:3-dehydroquinate synthase
MAQKLICKIPRSPVSYPIEIEENLLSNSEALISLLNRCAARFVIIADESTADLFGNELVQALSKYGLDIRMLTFPAGEENKTRWTKEILENQLLENKYGRDTCIIALGGGVTTDMAGYIAATYCRGVPLIMIPTSLLAMVDASLGGKTGVNVPAGKNLIGSIYQPQKVLIDISTLKSLPLTELRNGIVEMVKHGLIADAEYFDFLDKNYENILALDPETMQKAIYDSCVIKNKIVEEDESEKGMRRLLNFGHTVAHALETVTRYAIPHGAAVAIGMLVEGHISMQMGHLDIMHLERIRKVLKQYNLPLKLPHSVDEQSMMDAMEMDKKSEGGKPRFVILKEIGAALNCENKYCSQVDEDLIRKALKHL